MLAYDATEFNGFNPIYINIYNSTIFDQIIYPVFFFS